MRILIGECYVEMETDAAEEKLTEMTGEIEAEVAADGVEEKGIEKEASAVFVPPKKKVER